MNCLSANGKENVFLHTKGTKEGEFFGIVLHKSFLITWLTIQWILIENEPPQVSLYLSLKKKKQLGALGGRGGVLWSVSTLLVGQRRLQRLLGLRSAGAQCLLIK